MEADLIASEASVYTGKQGKQIGDERFNGVDDATVEGAWGSFAFDDEGTPAQRRCCSRPGLHRLPDRPDPGSVLACRRPATAAASPMPRC